MSPPSPQDSARARLKAAGLRVTPARLAILAQLARRASPMRAAEIRREIGPSRCDRVTVYRALAALTEAGLLRRALCPGGGGGYESSGEAGERYRVVCRKTGRIDELDPALLDGLSKAVREVESKLRDRGYAQVGHRLEFSAVAPPAEPPSPES